MTFRTTLRCIIYDGDREEGIVTRVGGVYKGVPVSLRRGMERRVRLARDDARGFLRRIVRRRFGEIRKGKRVDVKTMEAMTMRMSRRLFRELGMIVKGGRVGRGSFLVRVVRRTLRGMRIR